MELYLCNSVVTEGNLDGKKKIAKGNTNITR